MKILLIGGTGTISMDVTQRLCGRGDEVYLINRGTRNSELPADVKILKGDIGDEEGLRNLIGDMKFDSVADFIAFEPDDIRRDFRLFNGRTKQFVFISSASAYHKPVKDFMITEGTTLANPYWGYSRNKIACEELLLKLYREEGFPITIVRPSHTYNKESIPVGIHGHHGSWQVLKRMLDGKQVIIHGDGTSLWTMTHSRDFAKAFVGLLGNSHAIGEPYTITSDEALTWNQIYQTIADTLGVKLNAVHVSSEFLAAASDYDFTGGLIGDKANTVVFDNTKIKRTVPGWCAQISYAEGVRESIGYIMTHPEYQTEDVQFDRWCDHVINAQIEALNYMKSHQQ